MISAVKTYSFIRYSFVDRLNVNQMVSYPVLYYKIVFSIALEG